jgi:acetyl esterase
MKNIAAIIMSMALASSAIAQQPQGSSADSQNYLSTSPPTAVIPIDPKRKLELDRASQSSDASEETAEQLRAAAGRVTALAPRLNEPVARIENQQIAGPAGPIPIRIYTPKGKGPFPVLVFFHGGGWVVGTLDGRDDVCQSLANRAGVLIVSVDYRLAPEHKFPAAAEDSYAASRWAAMHANDIGGDSRRVAVAGDSAGGNLAAATALYARDKGGPRLVLQVLVYPVTNYDFDTASYHENAVGYGLTRDRMIFYWGSYLASPRDGESPYASPLRAKDLHGLPPALILTAQYDPLRDDGEAYAARLHQAGIPVHVTRYLDMTHGFLASAATYPQANKAVQEIAMALRKAFAQ